MKREDAAPTFESWKQRIEHARPDQVTAEIERFMQMLSAVGTPLIDGAKVHFVYRDSRAADVKLAGEFNDWGERGDAIPMDRLAATDLFCHTLVVPGSTRLEYKFIVDGAWKIDPLCHNRIGQGNDQTTYFVVGDFRDPPELEWVADLAHGRVEEFDFAGARLLDSRRVYAYLPAAYDHDPAARFPTLYVHDGGEYLEHARMPTLLDNLIHAGEISPMIAVMIDPVERQREYRINDEYRDFLCMDFVPMIDQRYRTAANREGRGVMGASLGGLISAYTALSQPQMFSKVGGQSSAFHYAENELNALADKVEDVSFRFYLDVGVYEPRFTPANRGFAAHLQRKGWPCRYQEVVGAHNWTTWRSHLKDLLIFLWGPAP